MFYHDCELSNGVNYKRNIKLTSLKFNLDGTINQIEGKDNE